MATRSCKARVGSVIAFSAAALLAVHGCVGEETFEPAGSPLPQPIVIEEYEALEGVLRIGPGPDQVVPLGEKGHTLILPSAAGPAGVAVFLDGRRIQTSPPQPGAFEYEALSRNLGVLRITTGNPLDFFFEESTVRGVVERLQAVLQANDLGDRPLYFAGLSLGGTRALKLAVFLEQRADEFWATPTAAAIVDAPLDMVRLWESERRAARIQYHPAAAGEGEWVSYVLEAMLGGTPDTRADSYVEYSPFVYSAPGGGNARYLRDLPLRAYHEPDVDWWIENRRKSYYGMNSIDQAALITELRIQGNDAAELVTTHQARVGIDEGATPHTWSFVDNAGLVSGSWTRSRGRRDR